MLEKDAVKLEVLNNCKLFNFFEILVSQEDFFTSIYKDLLKNIAETAGFLFSIHASPIEFGMMPGVTCRKSE